MEWPSDAELRSFGWSLSLKLENGQKNDSRAAFHRNRRLIEIRGLAFEKEADCSRAALNSPPVAECGFSFNCLRIASYLPQVR